MLETVCGLVVIVALVMIAHGALTQRHQLDVEARWRRIADDAREGEARRRFIRAQLDD